MHVMWKLVDRQNHGSCRLVDRQKPPFLILTCIFATFPMHVSWKFVDRQNHGFLRGEGKIGEDKIKKIQNSTVGGYAARGYLASQLEEPPTLGPPSK
jgi:hypothetical protein